MKKLATISNLSLLSVSTGLIYLWFGVLKFFSGYSPAEGLAIDTIKIISFDLIPDSTSIMLLAIWETAVGVFLIFNFFRKQAAIAGLVHMLFTFFPLFLFSELSFDNPPLGFSLLGQYIFKNILIIAAFIVILRKSTSTTIAQ